MLEKLYFMAAGSLLGLYFAKYAYLIEISKIRSV